METKSSSGQVLDALSSTVARIQAKSQYLCSTYDDTASSAEVVITALQEFDLQMDQAIRDNSDADRLRAINDMLENSLPHSLIAIIQDMQARFRTNAKLFRVFGTQAQLATLLGNKRGVAAGCGLGRADAVASADTDVAHDQDHDQNHDQDQDHVNDVDNDWQRLHPSFRICGNGDVIRFRVVRDMDVSDDSDSDSSVCGDDADNCESDIAHGDSNDGEQCKIATDMNNQHDKSSDNRLEEQVAANTIQQADRTNGIIAPRSIHDVESDKPASHDHKNTVTGRSTSLQRDKEQEREPQFAILFVVQQRGRLCLIPSVNIDDDSVPSGKTLLIPKRGTRRIHVPFPVHIPWQVIQGIVQADKRLDFLYNVVPSKMRIVLSPRGNQALFDAIRGLQYYKVRENGAVLIDCRIRRARLARFRPRTDPFDAQSDSNEEDTSDDEKTSPSPRNASKTWPSRSCISPKDSDDELAGTGLETKVDGHQKRKAHMAKPLLAKSLSREMCAQLQVLDNDFTEHGTRQKNRSRASSSDDNVASIDIDESSSSSASFYSGCDSNQDEIRKHAYNGPHISLVGRYVCVTWRRGNEPLTQPIDSTKECELKTAANVQGRKATKQQKRSSKRIGSKRQKCFSKAKQPEHLVVGVDHEIAVLLAGLRYPAADKIVVLEQAIKSKNASGMMIGYSHDDYLPQWASFHQRVRQRKQAARQGKEHNSKQGNAASQIIERVSDDGREDAPSPDRQEKFWSAFCPTLWNSAKRPRLHASSNDESGSDHISSSDNSSSSWSSLSDSDKDTKRAIRRVLKRE